MNFGHPASWALGLGVLGGAIAGSVVPARTPATELRHIVGFILIFGPAIYVLIAHQETAWSDKHPYIRFVVFTLSILIATVALMQPVVFVFGSGSGLARGVGFVAGVTGFAVAVWTTFYGGAEALWAVVLDVTDTEW